MDHYWCNSQPNSSQVVRSVSIPKLLYYCYILHQLKGVFNGKGFYHDQAIFAHENERYMSYIISQYHKAIPSNRTIMQTNTYSTQQQNPLNIATFALLFNLCAQYRLTLHHCINLFHKVCQCQSIKLRYFSRYYFCVIFQFNFVFRSFT